jgi:ferredoxin
VNVLVSKDLCQGHNRCVEICPEVFTVDDMGFAEATATEVAPELTERVQRAADNCPERAISLDDPPAV